MAKIFTSATLLLTIFSVIFCAERETTIIYPPFKHTWGIHKGTETKLDMLLDNRTDFDNPQGIALTRLKSWDDPKDKTDDDQITAFGINSGKGEIIYNSSMYSLALYGNKGSGKGVILLGIASCIKGNTLILCHSMDIINQILIMDLKFMLIIN